MKAQLEVLTRPLIGREAWDDFSDRSDEAWLWHRFDFQDALATWRGSEDRSFAIVDPAQGDEILALVPLRINARRFAGVLPVFLLDSLGAVACRNGLQPGRRRSVLAQARASLLKQASQGHCLDIRLTCPPMAPAYRGENSPRVNPLLFLGCRNAVSQTWVINLRAGKDAIWAAMEGRARTAVRKAEKAGVKIRPAVADDLDLYYRLHVETYRRTGVDPHPRAYFQAIWQHLLPSGLTRVWVAELDGEAVAAENFAIYKNAALYWTGASSGRGLAVEAGSLLQWTAMQWMSSAGIAWYETGEAFPQALSGKAKGLNDFKKSFGGNLHPFFKGSLPTGNRYERLYRILQVLTD
jgi:hypothetical protein